MDPADQRRSPVVEAKLRPPRLRAGELHRDHLVAALCAATVPVVAVHAPAGYGKTTTVRQWIEADPRLSAWLSLDGADNDPVRFLRHVVRAVDGIVPVPRAESLLLVEPPQASDVLAAFATALVGQPPLILVLDDVQVVEDGTVADLVVWLGASLPVGSTLALVGRSLPSVRLAHHLAGDDAVVLRRDDLAFDDREHRAVVDAAPVTLDDGQVDALHERTEGWPAGLQLSLLAARAAPDPAAVLADLPHRAEDLGGYVHEGCCTASPRTYARSSCRRRCSTGSRRRSATPCSTGAAPARSSGRWRSPRTCSWSPTTTIPSRSGTTASSRTCSSRICAPTAPSSNRCSGDERRAGSTPTAIRTRR